MLRLLVALALVLAACGSDDRPATDTPPDQPADEETVQFRKDGTLDFVRDGETLLTIDIEIAETDSARTRGLMQRTNFPDRSGMLFVFEREEPQSFWMANTPMALDLIFVNADSHIVDIDKYARPLSPEPIASDAPAQYVVEVPAGFADTHGLIETDRVRWRRDTPAN